MALSVAPESRMLPTEESVELLHLVREIADAELAPRVAAAEHDGTFFRDELRTLGRAGLLSLPYAEEWGGGGQPYEVYLQVLEELAGAWLSVGISAVGARALLLPGRGVRHRRAARALAARACSAASCSAPTACPSRSRARTPPRCRPARCARATTTS